MPPKKRKNRSLRYIVSKAGSIFYSFSLPLFSFKLLPPTKKVSNFQRMFLTGPHFGKLVTQFTDYFSSWQSWPTRQLLHNKLRYTPQILGYDILLLDKVIGTSTKRKVAGSMTLSHVLIRFFSKCNLTFEFYCLKRNVYKPLVDTFLAHSLLKNAFGIWMGLLFDIAKCCSIFDVEKMRDTYSF